MAINGDDAADDASMPQKNLSSSDLVVAMDTMLSFQTKIPRRTTSIDASWVHTSASCSQ